MFGVAGRVMMGAAGGVVGSDPNPKTFIVNDRKSDDGFDGYFFGYAVTGWITEGDIDYAPIPPSGQGIDSTTLDGNVIKAIGCHVDASFPAGEFLICIEGNHAQGFLDTIQFPSESLLTVGAGTFYHRTYNATENWTQWTWQEVHARFDSAIPGWDNAGTVDITTDLT